MTPGRSKLGTAFVLAAALWPRCGLASPRPHSSDSQSAGPSTTVRAAEPAGSWTLRVVAEKPLLFTVVARAAPLAGLAADLQRQLGAPVRLSPLLAKSLVTTRGRELALEDLLLKLAPRAFVDYQVSSEAAFDPKIVEIVLKAEDEPAPEPPRDRVQTLMIEGDTEDPDVTDLSAVREAQEAKALEAADKKGEPALFVTCHDGLVTVRARQQPLTVVLYEIAARANIPFKLSGDVSTDLVDLDYQNLPIDQLPQAVGPGVRVDIRRDVRNARSQALRVVIEEPRPSGRLQ